MALPKKLKYHALFNDQQAYLHEVPEVVLPSLGRLMEDYRAAGMDRAIKSDMGGEPLTMDWTLAGMVEEVFTQYGAEEHDAVYLRFVGSYQAEDSADPMAVEVEVRGRHSKIDPGTAKTGDATAIKITSELSYYKLTMDGKELVEIDIANFVEKIDGKDRMEKHRNILGA